MNKPKPKPKLDYTEQPIYWFAVLDQAVECGNFQLAANAQAELERLGVTVRYGKSHRTKSGEVKS